MKSIAKVLFGAVLGAAFALWIIKERVQWLSSLTFTLEAPPVPLSVLASIREAEDVSYAGRSPLRRLGEAGQDILVFASPELAYRLNSSVGRYRIKAQTIEAILPWAIDEGYLVLDDIPEDAFAHALAYFSEQPALNDWQAAVYLAWLRSEHAGLAAVSWPDIAADPELVAKLYSGYMGAGGAWDAWRADLVPGPVARRRLGLN
ncbi:hypothetical protein AADZ90_000040 [Aestuariibius sp. 2305UL40-4]|uniref:hypothetical protein n=1 Tax=Aestuariibius violaceus TaxID=3234132 RepID=UPI00345E4FC3